MPRACLSDGEGRSCMASSVPERTLRQRLTFSQGFVEVAEQELRHVCQERRNKAREGCIGARIILSHDGLAQSTKSEAEVVSHGGHQGATHDAASATPSAVRRPKPPQVTPVVACHREWSGKSPVSDALTEARHCPSKTASKIIVKNIPVDAHEAHEDHLRGCMIDAANRGAHLVAGSHR